VIEAHSLLPYSNHFIRERFPPPVVTMTRFITMSIVS
jgi:hypothetical protein